MIDDQIDDYLWDQSGSPDERVRALELLLERYRFDGATVALGDVPAADVDPAAAATSRE